MYVANERRPDWDEYFLAIAGAVSLRADCRRRHVGAVLVRPDRTVASTGYNGHERKGISCLKGQCPRGLLTYEELAGASSYDNVPAEQRCESLHAELNCLMYAREDTTDYVMYITDEPCSGCIRTMRAARLRGAAWPGGTWRL